MATSIKTAISMQEELFDQVNTLAGKLQISRSKLFVMAVQDFIKKEESHKLLLQINDAFDDHPDSDESEIHHKMRLKQKKNLEREQW